MADFQDRLSANGRRIIFLAGQRAQAAGRPRPDARDVLTALLEVRASVGGHLLREICTDPQQLLSALDDQEPSQPKTPPPRDCPSAPADVIATARAEARALGHSYIGSEHLLLAAIAELPDRLRERAAALGVRLYAARRQLLNLLGAPPRPPGAPGAAGWLTLTLGDFPAQYRDDFWLRKLLVSCDMMDTAGRLKLESWGLPAAPPGADEQQVRAWAVRVVCGCLEKLAPLARDLENAARRDANGC